MLGATLPLSGPLAGFGTAQQRGLQAVVDEANVDGGVVVGGERRRLELLVLDSRGDADVAGQRALVLVRRRDPAAVLLGACSPPATVVRVAEARDVPLVSACGPLALPDSPDSPAVTWQLGPDVGEQAAAVAAALGPAGLGPVALLASAGRSTTAHADALAAAGQPVAGAWSRGPAGLSGEAGWREPLLAARAAGATRVLALTDPPDGRALWQALDRDGWTPAAAYVHDAALTPDWPDLPRSDGVLTDLPSDGPLLPEALAEQAARQAGEALLDALARAGSARSVDVARALAEGPTRLLGTPGGDRPARLGVWTGGVLRQR